MGVMKKRPSTDAELGLYEISGSLEGLKGPGRRFVRELEVRRLSDGDLTSLRSFSDLDRLVLDRPVGVDLASLPPFRSLDLNLQGVRDVDLSPLDGRTDISRLALVDCRDCRASPPLRLPALRALLLADHSSGDMARQLIEALDWSQLDGLLSLEVRVSGPSPLEVDLTFLRHLQVLERLDLVGGIRHVGQAPSPLHPPFDGLSERLTHVSFEARDAGRVSAALRGHLGAGTDKLIAIEPRFGWEPGAPWSIEETGYGWQAFGSFVSSLDGAGATEDRARGKARRRLVEIDATLASRLEFDPWPPGSAVVAPSREDSDAMLAHLEIDPTAPIGDPSGHRTASSESPEAEVDEVSDWAIMESQLGGWSVYGSLFEVFDGGFDTEYEAMREAQKRIRRSDGALERRVEFDHESDGTGVHAERREDLEAMLRVLGLPVRR